MNVRDSGAILAGAFCAKDGKKRRSAPMARALPVLRGCWDVVTTGYGDLYKTLALTIPIPRLLPEPLPRTRLLRVW